MVAHRGEGHRRARGPELAVSELWVELQEESGEHGRHAPVLVCNQRTRLVRITPKRLRSGRTRLLNHLTAASRALRAADPQCPSRRLALALRAAILPSTTSGRVSASR